MPVDPLSVLAIITFIKDVVEQVRALKDTIDKVSDNDEKCKDLVAGILESLETLRECCESGKLEDKPQLQRDLSSFTRKLKRTITECEELVSPDRSGIRTAIGMWWKGDKIASKLNAIQDDLTRRHQMFIMAGVIRSERSGSAERAEMNHRLIDLDAKVQAMINEGAKRPEKAQSLVRVDRMDHRQMKTALRRASNALIHDKPSAIQKQYLQVKVGTLKEALKKPISVAGTRDAFPRFMVSRTPSSSTHHPRTGAPAEDSVDAVMETLEILQILRTQDREMSRGDLAHRLNTLSTALFDIGLFDDSCTVSHQAVRIYRDLVRSGFAHFEHNLAAALNNLSIHIDGNSHRTPAKALDVLCEAIDIYRRLVKGGQSVFNSDLATLLINLATRLGQLKQYNDAAKAAMEALDIFTILDDDNCETFTSDLAVSLVAVSTSLRHMKQNKDALLAAQRAVKIFRSSKVDSSRQFQPELAAALNAYSRSLGDHSRFKEALEAAEEAANIRRTLAGERPEIYTQPFVLSLRDVFNLRRQRGNHRGACSAAEEVADIYRNLIHDGFEDFKFDLASLLVATSNSSLDLNRNDSALTSIKEAIRLYAQLASAAADKYKASVHADSLDIAHSCYTRLGRDHDAYRVACEAIEIRENLGHGQSERDSKFFASSITNSAKSLLKLERFADARKKITQAISIYSNLAGGNSQKYQSELAFLWSNLSSCLSKLKCDDEALEASKQAVKIYRKLASHSSNTVDSEQLAVSLYNLSQCQCDQEAYTEALQSAEEAVRILKGMCSSSSADRPRLDQAQKLRDKLKGYIERKSRSKRD
ncbi:hypothetical protein PILCRDRAFT_90129 [Piloderma croceum F 1598]|uniref:Uncharacterized protein n=1 Tax=Piloderma croceum (strain F 1598) TaxID=765440 RepID=A0A0C3F420_PILCF|nr:hypothetical protein PILCRDRAFT_90129 [Piloderma croceum F 1598]